MNTIEYKGFTIDQNAQTGMFSVIEEGGKTVDGFKYEGYATLNAAKGAITKRVNASEAETAHLLSTPANAAHLEASMAQAKAATSGDKERASVPLIDEASEVRIQGMTQALLEGAKIGWTAQRNDKDMPIHGDPTMAKIYAEMDYYGMSKTRDTRSRNKREGTPARRFKWQTKHMTGAVKNRKQAKADKLARKAAN